MRTTTILLKDTETGAPYHWTLSRERFLGGSTAYVCKGHDSVERVLEATNREGALGEVRQIAERHALEVMN